jgi:outer membrane protein assembly factor BamD
MIPTIYIAKEALHRLVEVHYQLGLKEEAKKYASVLGYNYESSVIGTKILMHFLMIKI